LSQSPQTGQFNSYGLVVSDMVYTVSG